jgi:succinate-semialdehyde dehydrogenase/glutarate-semialdehyde dehydrogenase
VIESPRVRGVSLPGSDRAGGSVAQEAGANVTKSVLELGGSDPFIVLDADRLERTADAATKGRLSNTGQSCVASERFLVLAEIFDRFLRAMRERFARCVPATPPIRPRASARCPPRARRTR